MPETPVYIPDNCQRVTVFRRYEAFSTTFFFRFELLNNTHSETSTPGQTKEQIESVKVLFEGWHLIEEDSTHQVYERNEPR